MGIIAMILFNIAIIFGIFSISIFGWMLVGSITGKNLDDKAERVAIGLIVGIITGVMLDIIAITISLIVWAVWLL